MNHKCPCQNCNGHIEFDASDSGRTVNCPHCSLETLLFVPGAISQESNPSPSASEEDSGGTERTKTILLGVLALAVVSGLAFYLIHSGKLTPRMAWQILITLVFCGIVAFTHWRFPSNRYLFAESLIRYIEHGSLFSRVCSFLLRFCGFSVGLVAFIVWFRFWGDVVQLRNYSLVGGVLFQIVFLIGGYLMVHIFWIRATSVEKAGISDFTVIPICSILLKMYGELTACLIVGSGLGLGIMSLFGVTGESLANMPLLTQYYSLIYASSDNNVLGALAIICAGIAVGFFWLVVCYLLSELLVVVFDIARNLKAVRKQIEQTKDRLPIISNQNRQA